MNGQARVEMNGQKKSEKRTKEKYKEYGQG